MLEIYFFVIHKTKRVSFNVCSNVNQYFDSVLKLYNDVSVDDLKARLISSYNYSFEIAKALTANADALAGGTASIK